MGWGGAAWEGGSVNGSVAVNDRWHREQVTGENSR